MSQLPGQPQFGSVPTTQPTKLRELQPQTQSPTANFNIGDPRNPDYQKQAKTKKILTIGFIILILAGLVMVGRKYPKATIGTIAVLFIFMYFFFGFMGPSRYQQWKSRNNIKGGGGRTTPAMPVIPAGA